MEIWDLISDMSSFSPQQSDNQCAQKPENPKHNIRGRKGKVSIKESSSSFWMETCWCSLKYKSNGRFGIRIYFTGWSRRLSKSCRSTLKSFEKNVHDRSSSKKSSKSSIRDVLLGTTDIEEGRRKYENPEYMEVYLTWPYGALEELCMSASVWCASNHFPKYCGSCSHFILLANLWVSEWERAETSSSHLSNIGSVYFETELILGNLSRGLLFSYVSHYEL